ncbi:hypothetical protein BDM02DRAFT_3107210 [Thelephora ganbajun]|uniref:Uncharacterized protein n=1 Tax=Thelephora ganbajun TaxID=370292 RepID=A0ACB6ZWT9_THEGA|nr:hypothetical protein BDM02DRAFT_3107210 [Thelephora ganbajun]
MGVPSYSTNDPSNTGSIPSSTTGVLSNTNLPSSTGVPSDSTVTGLPPASSGSVPPPVPSSTVTSSIVPPSDVPAVIGTSSVPRPTATLQPSPTATSENAGTSAPFDPPGKKLEVLPIGLGVFAGVSVIALFVVGVVTYERTKHRRNFRRLRLEEAGNRMGYGTA